MKDIKVTFTGFSYNFEKETKTVELKEDEYHMHENYILINCRALSRNGWVGVMVEDSFYEDTFNWFWNLSEITIEEL
jgi:hypothetical protein